MRVWLRVFPAIMTAHVVAFASTSAHAVPLPWKDDSAWHATLEETGRTLTYSFDYDGGITVPFRDDGSNLVSALPMSELSTVISDWEERIEEKLRRIGEATNITFVQVPDSGGFNAPDAQGIIRFKLLDYTVAEANGVLAYATFPPAYDQVEITVPTDGTPSFHGTKTGDVYLLSDILDSVGSADQWGETVAHELGHSMGLIHPYHLYNPYPSSMMSYYNPMPDSPTNIDVEYLKALYLPDDDSAAFVGDTVSSDTTRIKLTNGAEGALRSLTVEADITSNTDRTPGIKGEGTYLINAPEYGISYISTHLHTGQTVATSGAFSHGILGYSGNVLNIDGTIQTQGLYADGVYLSGYDNSLTLGSGSTVQTFGDYAAGIGLRGYSYSGAPGSGVAIHSLDNRMAIDGTIQTHGWGGEGIYIEDQIDLDLEINGNINTTGILGHGVFLHDTLQTTSQIASSNALTLTGSIVTEGAYGAGIYFTDSFSQNTLKIDGGTITTKGAYSDAIYFSGEEQLFLQQNGTLTTEGSNANGIMIANGSARIQHGGTTTVPAGASAISLFTDGHVELNLLSGTTINGDIKKAGTSTATMQMGYTYDATTWGQSGLDTDFTFTYGDDVSGAWDYDIGAGRFTYTGAELTNTSTFANNGTYVGNLNNLGTVKGNGTFQGNLTNRKTVAPYTSVSNSIGTITVNGDYSQTANGNLDIEFDGTSSDKLIVSGTADLAGTVTIHPIGYVGSSELAFLSAGTYVDSGWTVVDPSAVYTTTKQVSGGDVTLSVTRNPYESLSTPAVSGFAASLDAARPNASGDMASILNALDGMSAAKLESSIAELSPQAYTSLAAASTELGQVQTSTLMGQISFSRPQATDMTSNMSLIQNNILQVDGDFSPWGAVILGCSSYDDTPESAGFSVKSTGVMFGMDQAISDTFQIGSAFSTGRLYIDNDDNTNSSDADFWELYLYSDWKPETDSPISIQTALGYGQTTTETQRDITFLGRTASGKSVTDTYSATVNLDYAYDLGDWSIIPHIGGEYYHSTTPEVQETGAGSANLTLDAKTSDTFISNTGIKVRYRTPTIGTYLSANWLHNFADREPGTTGHLATGETFRLDGRQVTADTLQMTTGFSAELGHGFSGQIEYQHGVSDDMKYSSQVALQLRYQM